MAFAPGVYAQGRADAARMVDEAFRATANLSDISAESLARSPKAIAALRMTTRLPLARDRLAGLSSVARGVFERLEQGFVPLQTDFPF